MHKAAQRLIGKQCRACRADFCIRQGRLVDEAGGKRDHGGILNGLFHQETDRLLASPLPALAEANMRARIGHDGSQRHSEFLARGERKVIRQKNLGQKNDVRIYAKSTIVAVGDRRQSSSAAESRCKMESLRVERFVFCRRKPRHECV